MKNEFMFNEENTRTDLVENNFIAHIREGGDSKEQSLINHLSETAKLAKDFAEEFGYGTYAYSCGLIHDIGKYSKEFQNRIKNKGKKCDHATAGARVAMSKTGFGKIAAYCIAGHHSGLTNIGTKVDGNREGTLYSRLSNEYKIPNYEHYKEEIDETDLNFNIQPYTYTTKTGGFGGAFLTRMIYSCLTDADYLDTEKYMNNEERRAVCTKDFSNLYDKLQEKIHTFDNAVGIVNETRRKIRNECELAADQHRGLFTLTVPTGGGKTISSMAFALKHLLRNGMRRIIYVIPYTSIIEQNAEVFSNIFGSNAVLEHHSNYNFGSKEDMDQESLGKFKATENWDMPIVVTTNVQFFESLFASRSSKCRKLHNIVNSVIVFDEAQMLPVDYLMPTITAIAELVLNYRCTCVLCSATQPALNTLFPQSLLTHEICKDVKQYANVFKRTEIIYEGDVIDQELIKQIHEINQVLVILNTRKHTKMLYESVRMEGVYHLSTLMCSVHRKEIIQEIKKRLQANKSCKVVSTRLVEAGVDLDFPQVYRALCGMDSIIQSAGRCNREGKLTDQDGNKICGKVHVFKEEEQYYKKMPHAMLLPIQITKTILEDCCDLEDPEVMRRYFNELFFYKGDHGLDIKDIVKELDEGIIMNSRNKEDYFNYNFKTIDQKYKLLEDNTYAIIIPYDENALKLIEKLDYVDTLKITLRQLQPYTVNVYSNEYMALQGAGKLKIIADDMAVLRSIEDYSKDTGLQIDIQNGIGVFM